MSGTESIIIVVFVIFSFVISLLDIKTGVMPRIIFIVAFFLFFTLNILRVEHYPLIVSIAGALLGLFVFSTAFFISKKMLGLADIWYSGLIGLVLGPLLWYTAIGIACLTGITYVLIFKKRRIPFIPFMAAGSVAMSIVQGLFL